MSKIVVTGFKPFSLLTWCTGNPSETVATALGKRYGPNAHVSIMNADATCLAEMKLLEKMPGVTGILMFGAGIQTSSIQLELEGVSKADGLFGSLERKTNSLSAHRLLDYAKSLGIPTATAPITPLVYWCLRSYAVALEWAEPRNIPCLFMHVNTLRISADDQIEIAAKFFEKIRTG